MARSLSSKGVKDILSIFMALALVVGDQNSFLDLVIVLDKVLVKLKAFDAEEAENLAVQVEECCKTEGHENHGEEDRKILSQRSQIDWSHHDDKGGVWIVGHHHKVVGKGRSETTEIRGAEEEGIAVAAAVRDKMIVVEETKTEETRKGTISDENDGKEDQDLEDEIRNNRSQETDVE